MDSLYLDDSYLHRFDALIKEVEDKCIILDRTAFYPQSGGQPSDTGVLVKGREEFPVAKAIMHNDRICHEINKTGLEAGDLVIGIIDWDLRYRFMRSHTACHVLSAVIFRETGAKITGNQIDIARSRVDFSLEKFERDKLDSYVSQANEIISKNLDVKIRILPRSEAMEISELVKLAKEVPDREEIRIVEIEGVDVQACGGTHVKKTGEIGSIKMTKAQNKGKANRRVYFELVDGG
jgi:misacylated tRNA(Ala) deacylase